MDPDTSEIAHHFPPFFKIHKDGRVERFMVSPFVPPTLDPQTGVQSKDVLISPETGVTARIFLPKTNGPDPIKKLPLVVHYHGGGFCVGSALGPATTLFLTRLVSEANVVAVSIDYRLAPEHPLPIAFDDSWSALQWIFTHCNGTGPESWLNQYADFGLVFLTGESAGATIAHNMAVRVGTATGLEGLRVRGAALVHPYFANDKPNAMMRYMYPGSSGTDSDPIMGPKADSDLGKMGCEKVLVFVAEHDLFGLRPIGVEYCETLRNSGWKGHVELVENQGEDHVFHLVNPTCENALFLVHKLGLFFNDASE